MKHQHPWNIKLNLFVILSLSGCCTHQSPQSNNGVCDINSSTEFGNTLLTDARRISGNQNITVFTSCKELDELLKNIIKNENHDTFHGRFNLIFRGNKTRHY